MIVRAPHTALALSGGALVLTMVLAGCAPGDSSNAPAETISQEDFDEAMSTPTELTFWTWVPGIEDEVAMFEEAYPEIDVTVENVGQGGAQYTRLRTALDAGDGAPDVAQVEYQQLPSFAVTESLLDLTPFGAADLADDFVPWVWNQVAVGDSILAIPQDTGPMGNLYRTDILEAAGVTSPPETWEDYAVAAEQVKSSTGSYISDFEPDIAKIVGLLWQAGAKPFGYDGAETVTIDVASDEAKEVMAYWQDLLERDLVGNAPSFNDEWYQSLNQGVYAGWLTAAWAPLFLQGTAESTSGNWAAAPLPQWDPASPATGNWGGSSNAVLSTTENPIAAYELARWLNTEPEPTLSFANEKFLFPAANAVLEDEDWSSQQSEFFGGQDVNAVFAEISTTVDTEFQWLPFMDFAGTSFETTIGAAIAERGDLVGALDDWQAELETYATSQGFTVN